MKISPYCRRCGVHDTQHDDNGCDYFEYQPDTYNPNLRSNSMADKNEKNLLVKGLMDEARAEVLKENRKVWIKEIKEKMQMLTRAKKVLANVQREIEDLEIKISQELV